LIGGARRHGEVCPGDQIRGEVRRGLENEVLALLGLEVLCFRDVLCFRKGENGFREDVEVH
jgi:hypothetical protein